jgi:hypothetical protein
MTSPERVAGLVIQNGDIRALETNLDEIVPLVRGLPRARVAVIQS